MSFCCYFQLAICIDKKRELNEDFEDCFGSEDHSVSDIEVSMVLQFTIIF